MSNEFVDQRSSFLEKCQMYHWQFDEEVNAAHSTLMLLYYLHGMHRTAAAARQKAAAADLAARGLGGAGASSEQQQRSRSSKIEMAMQDWTQLLNHANEAAASETWELPPEELFLRILAQINKSKRDILQEKYNQCRDPSTTAATRSVFIRVLKRCACRLDPDPTRSPDATPTRTRRPQARTPARARTRPRRAPRRRRRIAESFMSCLHNMQANRQLPNERRSLVRRGPRRREIRPCRRCCAAALASARPPLRCRREGTVGDGTRVVGRHQYRPRPYSGIQKFSFFRQTNFFGSCDPPIPLLYGTCDPNVYIKFLSWAVDMKPCPLGPSPCRYQLHTQRS